MCTGIAYLAREGAEAVALVGHSFGGAVVVRAATVTAAVRTVVTLATQSHGAEAVAELPSGCSILIIHGRGDRVLPPACSAAVHRLAHEPKRLVLYAEAGHGLDEAAEAVYECVYEWIVAELER